MEACTVDEANWLRKHKGEDHEGDFNMSSYYDACFWDFWKLVREPMCSTSGWHQRRIDAPKFSIDTRQWLKMGWRSNL